jgi:uncharacterized protein YegL
MSQNMYDSAVEVARRTMVLFFVVDTSGSMAGENIGAVNAAVQDVIPAIKEISDDNADAKIKIAALEFSNGAKWITHTPMEVSGFHWNKLSADGLTDFGAACKELNDKLSKSGFMSDASGSYAPAIFLLSDGQPTDNYQKPLDDLWKNKWFKAALKVAVAIGDVGEEGMVALRAFTGNQEAVLTVHTPEALKKMIRFVSVTASQIASKSSTAGSSGTNTKQEAMIKAIEQVKEEDLGGIEDSEWK